MKINIFRGDLTDITAIKTPLLSTGAMNIRGGRVYESPSEQERETARGLYLSQIYPELSMAETAAQAKREVRSPVIFCSTLNYLFFGYFDTINI